MRSLNGTQSSSRLNHHESCSHKSGELTQFTSQAKVNDLDPCTSCIHTDDVLRFEVQVNDILLVNVPHALQDLLHVAGTGGLRVLKVVIHEAFKELPTCNTGQTNTTVHYSTTLNYCSSGTPRFSRISHMVCSHFKVSTEIITYLQTTICTTWYPPHNMKTATRCYLYPFCHLWATV